jgi:hypothetical protein
MLVMVVGMVVPRVLRVQMHLVIGRPAALVVPVVIPAPVAPVGLVQAMGYQRYIHFLAVVGAREYMV